MELEIMIRVATLDDLGRLLELERRCFDTDRISRRSFRHLLTRARATTLVWDDDGVLGGYALVLFSKGTALSRLYSIAVDERMRGRGVGRQLLAAAERAALNRGSVSMRSEIRRDNAPSIALFQAAGYRQFGEVANYYEDLMDALRFERNIAPEVAGHPLDVPFYRQTTDFTCGPCAAMMAMRALDAGAPFDRAEELRLWRESTSIYMASGHGGCGPYGLAVAATKRGFAVDVAVVESGTFLSDTVRNPEKKEVMRVVEADYLQQAAQLSVPIRHSAVSLGELRRRVCDGAVPVVLISSHRIYEETFPHWVTVTGVGNRYVTVHDPFVDASEGETVSDSMHMPIAAAEFEQMSRYGQSGQRAILFLGVR
jgi:ribosomal protein S18 acetylase RimI-like enzyme